MPSNRMTLFKVGEMGRAIRLASRSKIKAASEGSELQLTWPATIPKEGGRVVSISRDQIKMKLNSGKDGKCLLQRRKKATARTSRTKQVKFRLNPHVKAGDSFGDGDTIIASSMSSPVPPICPVVSRYDFLADLRSDERETVYAAVKALGFLPESAQRSVPALRHIMKDHADSFIGLEAAASLARLDESVGWNRIAQVATREGSIELRMEVALILAEFQGDEALRLLADLARNPSNPPELRAAGAWGMAGQPRDLGATALLRSLGRRR